MMKVFILAIICGTGLQGARADGECDGRPLDTPFCVSCSKALTCNADGVDTAKTKSCGDGTACKVESGEALCVDAKDVPGCACAAGTKSQCDEYNQQDVLVCEPAGGVLTTLTCGAGDRCISGECKEAAAVVETDYCTGAKEGTWVTASANCTAYGMCKEDKMIAKYSCEAGQYFDAVVTGKCASSPPQACAGCEDGDCADPTDCAKYLKCEDGKSKSVYECSDGSNTKFNYTTKTCDGTDDAVCDPRIKCEISDGSGTGGGSTGGSGTTTAGGSGTTTETPRACSASTPYAMYEDPDDCKRYYQCALTTSGAYTIVRGTCPGRLVFNRTTKLCDLKSEVTPTCDK